MKKVRSLKIAGSITTIIVLLLSFNHCVVSQKKGKNKKSSTSNSVSTVATPSSVDTTLPETSEDQNIPNPNTVVVQTVEVGVKNFEQILNTMSELTGVSKADPQIRNTYNSVVDQLPTGNSIKSFQSANQVAIIKLAAEFCNELVESDELRELIWPNFNFRSSPNNELDTNGRNYLINASIDHFWLLSDEDYTIRFTAQTELKSLINDLLVGENMNSSSVTKEIGKGVCISTLGSIHAMML